VSAQAPSAKPDNRQALLHVESVPAGASVRRDGVELCRATPCDVLLTGSDAAPDRVLSLVLQKANYKPFPVDAKVADGKVVAKLLYAGGGGGAPKEPAPTPSGYKGAY
jgi:hypothetical protein